ncbi:MAG: hypothetical protein ABIT83_09930 [Massilia sp.]
MSFITIRDLSRSAELDQHGMRAVRGGFAFSPNVHANLNVDQKIFQVQDIDVNVLNNNGVIGAGFTGPKLDLDVLQQATNKAFIPRFV